MERPILPTQFSLQHTQDDIYNNLKHKKTPTMHFQPETGTKEKEDSIITADIPILEEEAVDLTKEEDNIREDHFEETTMGKFVAITVVYQDTITQYAATGGMTKNEKQETTNLTSFKLTGTLLAAFHPSASWQDD